MFLIVLACMLLMSVVTFFLYGADKRKAQKGKWRISESTLLLFSFLGGSLGAFLGMRAFRHKTQHWKFKILVPLFLVLHIALLVYLWLQLGK